MVGEFGDRLNEISVITGGFDVAIAGGEFMRVRNVTIVVVSRQALRSVTWG